MKLKAILGRVLSEWGGRIGSFIIGAGLMYHEVVVSETAEFLLVIVALWLMGFPIANILDALSNFGDGGREKGDEN